MHRIKEIKSLLRRHDYVPVAQKMGDGMILRVPTPSKPVVSAYAIKRGSESGIYFNSTRSPKESFIGVPEYAIRLFVMAEASACCGRVPISDRLICYLDEEGEEYDELEDIIGAPSTPEESAREGFLIKLFAEAKEDNFPHEFEAVAENHNVYEGYRLVKSFF